MAVYTVELDGTQYDVEGPDDRPPTETEVRGLLGGAGEITSQADAVDPAKSHIFENFAEGATNHFSPTALLKGVGQQISDLTDKNQYKGVLDNPIARNIPFMGPGTSYNGISAANDAKNRAAQELATGQIGSGSVDALKGLGLGAVAAPVEAGVDLYQGKPGAAGEVAGELGNLALMGLGKIGSSGKLAGLGEKLGISEEAAAKSYAEGLNPTKRFVPLAEKIAPGLMKEGVWGSNPSLQEAAAAGLDKAGAALDSAWEAGGNRDLPINNIKTALQQHIARLSPLGEEAEPLSAGKVNAAQNLYDYLERNADYPDPNNPEGIIPAAKARALRQLWDDPVARRNAYLPGADPSLAANLEAARVGGNALRQTIADIVPEAVEPNRLTNLYSNLDEVLAHQKAAPRGALATVLGTVAGSSLGPLGALKGAALAKIAHAMLSSPSFKTFTAIQRLKLAQALMGAGAGAEVGANAEGARQTPGDVYQGYAPPVDIALRDLQTNTAPQGPFEMQQLGSGFQPEETPFAKAQAEQMARPWEAPTITDEQWTGESPLDIQLRDLETNTNPALQLEPQQFQEGFQPEESPFQLAQRYGQTGAPAGTPTLNSVLEKALIDELLRRANAR